MLGALVEWGGVRSHVSRDRPMPGSCSSSASSAFFLSSPRASLSACADSLRARARPARPMRSNVSALGNTNRCAFISPLKRARMMRPSSVSNAARPARRPGERAVRCRRASLGPDGAAVRCGAPARGGSPGAGAYRSNQDHHRPEDSCAPAKRCRRESRVALRAPMPVQDVVKPLARPKNDGSGCETV